MGVDPPHHSFLKRSLNTALCVVLIILILLHGRKLFDYAPLTLESSINIVLAEISRRKAKRRLRRYELEYREATADLEKHPEGGGVQFIANIVGYREDPAVFKKCLTSYTKTPHMRALLVGIDGNQALDLEMVEQVQEVSHSLDHCRCNLLICLGLSSSNHDISKGHFWNTS